MAAVRLARFNTGGSLIVSLRGRVPRLVGRRAARARQRAASGGLPDAQGSCNPAVAGRHPPPGGEIAAVLVNPVQCFHPNAPPPNDAVLLTSGVRKTEESTAALRAMAGSSGECATRPGCPCCSTRSTPDSGWPRRRPGVLRRAARTWSSTERPSRAACRSASCAGTRALMRRFDPERPMRIAYVVGTFSAHPVVMGAMNEFLRWVTEPSTADAVRGDEPALQRLGAGDQPPRWPDAALPVRWRDSEPSGRVLFTEPAATTGSSSTTCAPRA